MAMSNYWFSPTYENPQGFSVWCVLAKLSTKYATTHGRNRCVQYPNQILNESN